AKFVVAEHRGASSNIDRECPARATQGEARHQGGHEAGVCCRGKFPCGGKQSHVEFQAGGFFLPSPRKPKERSDVILLKVFLLVLPKRRFAAHAYPGTYPDQGHRFRWLLPEWRLAGDADSGSHHEHGHGFCPTGGGGHDGEHEAQDQAPSEGTWDCVHAWTSLLEPTHAGEPRIEAPS